MCQALQLLGTVPRLESRFSEFKVCALSLNSTADSDLWGRVGQAGQGISSWSNGGGKALGQKQMRSICRVERDIIPGILQGAERAVPRRGCWHVGGGLECQVGFPVVATVASSRGAAGHDLTWGWMGWAFCGGEPSSEELTVSRGSAAQPGSVCCPNWRHGWDREPVALAP